MTLKKAGCVGLIITSVLYILNPTAGVFELLPDNLPFLGNVDEGLAVALIIASIHYIRKGTFRVIEK